MVPLRLLLENLPEELLLQIVTFLEIIDIQNCSLVSTKFNKLANDELLWKRICKHKFGLIDPVTLGMLKSIGWKRSFFIQRFTEWKTPKPTKSTSLFGKEASPPIDTHGPSSQSPKSFAVKKSPLHFDNGNTTASYSGLDYITLQSKYPILFTPGEKTHVEIKIDKCGGGIGIGLAMCEQSKSLNNKLDISVSGLSYFSNGCKYNHGLFYTQRYDRFTEGDIIGMDIDWEKREVHFTKNGNSLNLSFTLPKTISTPSSPSGITRSSSSSSPVSSPNTSRFQKMIQSTWANVTSSLRTISSSLLSSSSPSTQLYVAVSLSNAQVSIMPCATVHHHYYHHQHHLSDDKMIHRHHHQECEQHQKVVDALTATV